MPRFEVACINEEGEDLIIVPLEPSFSKRTPKDREKAIDELQERANHAGLPGTVLAVWPGDDGALVYIAPRDWRQFCAGISYQWVLERVNSVFYW